MKSTDLRPGMAIKIDGVLYVITQFTHATPGNLRAFVALKIKSVASGAVVEKRLRSGEEVEQVDVDKRPMEYLYKESGGYVFMDTDTFEQITISEAMIGEMMPFVKPNTVITVLLSEEKPVLIELPNVVELVITECAPGIKGATVTNQMKDAVCETGLKVRVPPFIEVGEAVRISTADGTYNSRA
ncbi:MAG: elongation factor P [Phycisphaerales bacterium]